MLSLVLLLGCDAPLEGPFALSYVGQPDCVRVPDMGEALAPPFTVELWMQLDPAAIEANHPLVSWTGLFDLQMDASDMLSLKLGSALAASYSLPLERDLLYNVAATYDGERTRLFLAGDLVAVAETAYDRTAGTELWIGCNDKSDSFWGILDEVRISRTARYTETFVTHPAPYTADGDTVALFHFEEGEGEETLDAVSGLSAEVTGPTWVTGTIGAKP